MLHQGAWLGGTALMLAGCSASRVSMQVPAQLSAAAPLSVTGKQGFKRSYQFGDFATTQVKPGWTSTSSWNIGRGWLPAPVWYEQSRAKRKFSFTLQPTGAAAPLQVQGAYYARSQDLVLAPAASRVGVTLHHEEVYSSIIQAPGQQVWQLVMESRHDAGSRPQFAQGTLSNGDSLLQVRPIARLMRRDGKPMTLPLGVPIGYEFVRPNGSVVAAVELIGRGRVWLAPTLAPELKGPVAAAVTSMLLQQE
ncbi:hypothetical protein B0919_01195 [Hymenobacter sp. CRA2]|nr:hypothetical protein B0919_01195 [Hymenobacter sp. CRA2]